MFWRQFKFVVKKNVLIKSRHLSDLLLEFLIPLVVVIGLWSVRLAINADVTNETIPNGRYYIETLDEMFHQPRCDEETLIWNCATLENTNCDVFDASTQSWEGCMLKKIAVAPRNSDDPGQVQAAKDFLLFVNQSVEVTANVSLFNYFDSESAFISYIRQNDYSRDVENIQMYSSAVIFNSDGPQWDYTIRLNKTMETSFGDTVDGIAFPSTEQKTDKLLKSAEDWPQSDDVYDYYPFVEGYWHSGLFTLTNYVNSFVSTQTCRDQGLCSSTEAVEVRNSGLVNFPNPKVEEDSFWASVGESFALLMILALLYPISNVIKTLVTEKETRLKEGMLMMALDGTVLAASWVFHFSMIFCPLAVALTLAGQGLFVYSDNVFIFLYFMTFFAASMAYCFLVSTLFSRAKSASILGCFVFFMGYFIFVGLDGSDVSRNELMLACLHPASAFTYGTLAFIEYEDARIGITENTWTTSDEYEISFADTLLMQCINTIYLSFFTWYLSQVWRTEFGLAKPWYFLFMPSYWRSVLSSFGLGGRFTIIPSQTSKSSSHREQVSTNESGLEMTSSNIDTTTLNSSVPIEDVTSNMKEQIENNECVHIAGLRKSFDTNTGKKVAVDGLNMTFYSSQITALLGHNGAGKSTVVSMLSGLYPPDEGEAVIAGYDISTEMYEARKLLGVCPQHDVLMPDLTVAEHLEFFAGIKGCPDEEIEDEVDRIVKSVGLTEKKNSKSKHLSGGQKRKLSVGIAFIGNSKIVILDEPTSGMDPYSRRFTWNVIRQHREGRVIILVTHFMDEADLLGDRIAIMGDGKLLCCGSSLFLKKRYGVGYNVTIEKKNAMEFDTNGIMHEIAKIVPDASVLTDVGTELTIQLPFSSSGNFESLFTSLDDISEEFLVSSYGMSVTTMEEVFLKVAAGTDTINTQASSAGNINQTSTGSKGQKLAIAPPDGESEVQLGVEEPIGDVEKGSNGNNHKPTTATTPFTHQTNYLFWRHMYTLLKKRYLYFSRDSKSWLYQYMLPVLFVVIGGVLMTIQTFTTNQGSLTITPSMYNPSIDVFNYPLPYSSGVCSWNPHCPEYPDSLAMSLMGQTVDASNLPVEWRANYTTYGNMSRFLLDHRKDYEASRYGAVSFQEILTHDNDALKRVEFSSHGNYSGVHSAPVTEHLVAQAIVRSLDPSSSLTMRLHPMPETKKQEDTFGQWSITNLVIFLALAISFVPAGMASFVVYEKETKSRHQQMVSGVSIPAYWFSTWLWDTISYQVTAWLILIVILSFKDDTGPLTNADAFPWTVGLLMLYGPAVAGSVYLASYGLQTSSGSQIVVIFAMFVQGLILSIVAIVLRFIPSTRDVYVNTIRYVFVFLPPFAVTEGLNNLALREQFSSVELGGSRTYSPGDMEIAGLNVIVLACESVLLILLRIALDYLILKPQLFDQLLPKQSPPPFGEGRDDDVLEEDQKVASGAVNEKNSTVLLKEMTKVYPGGKYAVRGVSLGIPMGQCFGLLGVNGAGKSSLLNMLSGEFPPTSGDAFISGINLITDVDECRKHIGFCPQFDALYDLLSGREHLEFYASIKGIKGEFIEQAVNDKLREMGLIEYADRAAGGYSGGNKRKLSVAMAMIGDPSIVFLDEPSTGMDPMARRFMWRVISDVVTNREQCSLILTTHSMEECEALCTRISIMVDGVLRCLGSSQRLRDRYGLGYQVEVLLKVPADEAIAEMSEQFVSSVGKDCSEVHCDFTREEAEQALAGIGKQEWSSRFTEHGSGSDVYASFLQNNLVSCSHLASWCILEQRFEALQEFFQQHFDGYQLRERQIAKVRVEVPRVDSDGNPRKLARMFGVIESCVDSLHILEYSIAQTSLEQIFNSFASQQVGETLQL